MCLFCYVSPLKENGRKNMLKSIPLHCFRQQGLQVFISTSFRLYSVSEPHFYVPFRHQKKNTIHTNQDVANKQNIFVLPPVSLLIVCSACGDQISVYILLPNAGKLKLDKVTKVLTFERQINESSLILLKNS